MKNIEKTIKAFANTSRLMIVRYLKKSAPASVEDIAEATDFSYKATSKHLAILYQANVLDRTQQRYEMHYRIASKLEPMATAIIKHL